MNAGRCCALPRHRYFRATALSSLVPRRTLRRGGHQSRRGAILPLVAFLLPVMAIMLGFAVDLAFMQTTRLELRAISDAAARAAATELSRTDDPARAIAKARSIASQNYVAGTPLAITDDDIQVGRSVPDASGKWVFNASGTPANAVRVLTQRTSGSAGGAIPLFFGSLVGASTFEPQQTATASFLNVDICLVLDRSTSMKLNADSSESGMWTNDPRFCSGPTSTSRWAALDSAVAVFVDELDRTTADEKVGLVTYSSAVTGFLGTFCGMSNDPSTINRRLHSNLQRITAAMNGFRNSTWNGNTDIEAGMRDGILVLTDPQRSRNHAERIMILMTDGYQNVGSAMAATDECRSARIVTHTITFGDYADQVTMRNVANATGGRHYHASTSAQLRTVFQELAAQLALLTD